MLQYIRLIMPTQYLPAGRNASEIAVDVETAVRDGRLRPGEALPPVRLLAAELGLSPATVASAYRDLRLKGIARGHRRAGTRITGSPPTAPRPSLTVPAGARNLLSGSPDPLLLPPLPGLRRSTDATISPRLYGDSPVSPRLARLASDRLASDRRLDAPNAVETVVGVLTYPHVPWTALQYSTIVLVLGGAFACYPFAKTTWLAFDLMLRPVTPEEMEWYRTGGTSAGRDLPQL